MEASNTVIVIISQGEKLGVGVEAAEGFAAQPAGGDVFFEERAGAVFGVPEALLQDVENVYADVQADEVG
jgi:hypothetical protein